MTTRHEGTVTEKKNRCLTGDESVDLLDELLLLLGLETVVPLGQARLAGAVLDQDELDRHLGGLEVVAGSVGMLAKASVGQFEGLKVNSRGDKVVSGSTRRQRRPLLPVFLSYSSLGSTAEIPVECSTLPGSTKTHP